MHAPFLQAIVQGRKGYLEENQCHCEKIYKSWPEFAVKVSHV